MFCRLRGILRFDGVLSPFSPRLLSPPPPKVHVSLFSLLLGKEFDDVG